MVKIEKAMIRPSVDDWLDMVRDELIFISWDGSNFTTPNQDNVNLKDVYEWMKSTNYGGEDSNMTFSGVFLSGNNDRDKLQFSEEDKRRFERRDISLMEAYKEGLAIPISAKDPKAKAWMDAHGNDTLFLLDKWAGVLYKMGFDRKEHVEIFSHIMKNPEYVDIGINLDPMLTIEKISYKRIRKETEESTEEIMILDKSAEMGLPFSDSKPPESIRIKFYDFNNSSFEDVFIGYTSRGVINPITQKEDRYLENFIPPTAVLEKYPLTESAQDKLKHPSVYIIRQKQIKELYNKINKNFGRSYSHKKESFSYFLQKRMTNLDRDDVTFVEPNLEPMKNVFKIDQDFRNQIYERFDNKGAKKVLEILQYELRLQGRKTREGRGSGKSDVEPNKSLAFHIYEVSGHDLYVNNSAEPLYFITFLQAARGDGSFEYYEDQIIFPNESNAANFSNYKIDNWLKISPNVVRRTKQDVLAYLDFIQSTYRTKKMIWDEIPANIKTSITENIKEIIERSLYGNLTMRTRRGAGGMRVTKNVLKSIVEFKQTAEQTMTNLFGGIKRFKDLNKEELATFIQNFTPPTITIDDTATDIYFDYLLSNSNYKISGRAGDNISRKEDYLKNRADARMKFIIMARGEQSAEMGLLLITFNYDENDKMDKIEATSFTLTREALEWRPSDTVVTSSKEISLEYPFDEIGVYMREIMTGPNTFTWRLQLYEGATQQRGFHFSMHGSGLDPTLPNPERSFVPLWSNLKANPIRGEVVGYAVGRGYNGGYTFVMPDSTLTAAGEAGQLCMGRIYIKYYDRETKNQIEIDEMKNNIQNENFTLEDLKGYIIAAFSDYRGACIKLDRDRVRNDSLAHIVSLTLQRKTYPDVGLRAITGRTIDDEIEQPSSSGRYSSHMFTDSPAGHAMMNIDYKENLKLYRKFGKEYFDFIDSKLKEALNNGTLKFGAKSVRVGTTDPTGYYVGLGSGNVTIIHEPPANVEEEGDDENE